MGSTAETSPGRHLPTGTRAETASKYDTASGLAPYIAQREFERSPRSADQGGPGVADERQFSPRSARVRPTSAESRAETRRSPSTFVRQPSGPGQCWGRFLADTVPFVPQLGCHRAKFGRLRASSGQTRPEIEEFWAQMRGMWTEFRLTSADFGLESARPGPWSTEIGLNSAKSRSVGGGSIRCLRRSERVAGAHDVALASPLRASRPSVAPKSRCQPTLRFQMDAAVSKTRGEMGFPAVVSSTPIC